MTTAVTPLRQCLADIETRLGWGPAEQWTSRDFDTLSERIASDTGVTLSATTLKRVWGRVSYSSRPSTTTLDALARFVGYEHWRAYRKATRTASAPQPSDGSKPPGGYLGKRLLIWVFPSLLVATLLILLLNGVRSAPASPPDPAPSPDPTDYALDLRPVTSGVPNSVVFTYAAAPDDEVYLQQSWDPARRERLDPNGTTHTSIYYLPGFYRAKLVVADRIVRERELMISSDGWVALIESGAVPVYLPTRAAVADGRLRVTEQDFREAEIPLQPDPPTAVLTHVGALDGLFTDDFTFRTRFRHDYARGSGGCQFVRIHLLLKNSAITTTYSAPGCVAELELFAGGRYVSGRDTDLSAFGVMGDRWVRMECSGENGLLTVRIDDRIVYQTESEEEAREIIGLRYEFAGPGAVDEVYFGNGAGEVWGDEFGR